MHLRSKLISDICQKIGSLDEKIMQNFLKMPILPPFFKKTTAFIEKQKKTNRFSIIKISVPTNFTCLR